MANENLADDLLSGVEEIAAFTGLTKREAYHLAPKGKLPVFKVGDRKWCARKSTLKAHIEKLEAARV
jgi:excisionase family DNA binding protein